MRDRLHDLCLYAAAISMLLVDWVLQGFQFGFGRMRITTQSARQQRFADPERSRRRGAPGTLLDDAVSTL